MAGKIIGWIISLTAFAGIGYLLLTRAQQPLLSFKTWGTLRAQFSVAQMPATYQLTSGMVGMYHYRNTLRIALTDSGMFMAPVIGLSRKPVFIPYTSLVQDTARHRFKLDFYTYTLFKAVDTYIALDEEISQTVIARQRQLNQP